MASNNALAEAGQRVLENNTNQSIGFLQMRSKPPMTTFSVKALSFYNSDY